ncbi:MAG: hypothetical protein WC427_00920 [Candidatus Paceibacterota bacterium]|jgi:hypothetical protein
MNKTSSDIFSLIDQIVMDYNLESRTKDPELEKRLSISSNATSKAALKALSEQKEPFASLIIYNLIENILNNKISPSQFKDNLSKRLNMDITITKEISEKILNSQAFEKERTKYYDEQDTLVNQNNIVSPKKFGISQELQ